MDRGTAKQNYDAAHREVGEATRAYLDAVQVSILRGCTDPDVTQAKERVTAARARLDRATEDKRTATP